MGPTVSPSAPQTTTQNLANTNNSSYSTTTMDDEAGENVSHHSSHHQDFSLLHDFTAVDTIGIIIFVAIILVLLFFYIKHLQKKHN